MGETEITKQLIHLNETVEKILAAMPGKESLPKRILNTAAAAAGALGILGIIDQIIKWAGG
ncbi:hypothetical protein FACS1894141_6780 [Spirochaetia bacterium]|nr:hypothetical protein FACS1894141_6780 [Spirochaetia bacterium]